MLSQADGLLAHTWTLPHLGEAIEVTARRTHLLTAAQSPPVAPEHLQKAGREEQERWVLAAAESLGLEAEPVMASFGDLPALVRDCAPAILRIPSQSHTEQAQYVCVIGRGDKPRVLGADLVTRRVEGQALADALSLPLIAPHIAQADFLLEAIQVPAARRAKTRRLVIQQQMGNVPFFCGWLLRVAPSARLAEQVRVARLWVPVGELLLTQFAQTGVLLLAWWFIGRMIYAGESTAVWLQAWALVLVTGIPLQLWLNSAQNGLVSRISILFRQRLMFGTLQLHPDQLRHEGFGQFFERMMEADQVEGLGLSGGVFAILAFIQLGAAVFILSLGANGIFLALSLVAFIAATLLLTGNYFRSNRSFDALFRQMTNDLAERMVGHRTRLAQQDPREWHTQEDDELERYLGVSQRLDRSLVAIDALPRLWVVVGIGGLASAFLTGTATATALVLSVGGILLASTSLLAIGQGFKGLVNAGMAWQHVKPLFQAASYYKPLTPAALAQYSLPAANTALSTEPVLRARNVTYRYKQDAEPVLAQVDCEIFANDRILLQGPSGGGKTTLAAVMAGLRTPETGSIVTRNGKRHGLNSSVLPRRVAMAPQFHENHIFIAPLSFNLLIGRGWPPTDQDIAEAEAVCRELGLGDLIRRLPGGMSQMVGDGGWQLSHGERSRVFIARALLQKSDLLILDESFGALDPENLRRALETTLRRAPALMVIAHP